MTPATYGLRVFYEDTDAGGIVYHARYLAFAERARTELLRALGLTHIELREEHGLIFVVRRAEVDYQRPARLDDWLLVTTTVGKVGGASCVLRQEVARQEVAREDGAEEDGTVAVVTVRLACVRADDGRPARWPARWLEVLAGAAGVDRLAGAAGVDRKD